MKYRASRAAAMGLLFALSIVLSFAESALIPPLPVPGLKIGLSNIVTMYCLFCMGRREAYMIAAAEKHVCAVYTRRCRRRDEPCGRAGVCDGDAAARRGA